MKKTITIILFALFVVTGFIGTQWSVVGAQGTIPPQPPEPPIPPIIIPVTGDTTSSITIPDLCKNVMVEIKYVARVIFLDCPKAGTLATMRVLTAEDIKLLKPLTFLTEVFQVTTEDSYQGKMIVGVFLTEAEKEKMKKDPEFGLYRFDIVKGEWERILATLDGDFFSAETDVPGIFVIGKK